MRWGCWTGGVKVRLHLELLCVGDDEPRAQMSEHLEDRSFVVYHVFFVEGLDLLLVDIHDDRLDAHLVNGVMVCVVRPHIQLLLLEFEEVSPFGITLDFRVDKVGIYDTVSVKVIVLGNNENFVLVENEQEISVPPPPPPPRSGREAACVVRELLFYVLDVVEVNIVHHRECHRVPFRPHLFGDGNLHLGEGARHRWARLAIQI